MIKRCAALWMIIFLAVQPLATNADPLIGAGIHYWRAVDSLDSEFDQDGVSYLLTYQGALVPLVKYQVNIEILERGFAGSKHTVYAPHAVATVGQWLYAGAGVGILYASNRFANKPYYLLRVGLDVPILPKLRLDINTSYHFSEWRGINRTDSQAESDIISLGTALRFSF